MTQQELQDIEERWKFGTNTREDVRLLLDELKGIVEVIGNGNLCTTCLWSLSLLDIERAFKRLNEKVKQ